MTSDRFHQLPIAIGSSSDGRPRLRGPLVEVRDAGRMGLGLFAVQDIPRGYRIVKEPAIYTVTNIDMPQGNWSVEDKLRNFLRSMARRSITASQLATIETLFYRPEDAQDETVLRVTRECLALRLEGEKLERMTRRVARFYAIFVNNGLMNLGSVDFGAAIFPTISRVNHACGANVFLWFNSRWNEMTMHAARDIKSGDQLFRTYIDSERCSTFERRDTLLGEFSFTCRCTWCACSLQTDPITQKMDELYWGVRFFLNPEERQSDPRAATYSIPSDTNAALRAAKEAASLTRHPLINHQQLFLCEIYSFCSLLCEQLGEWERAFDYARRDVEVQSRIKGIDAVDLRSADVRFRYLVNKRYGREVIPDPARAA